MDNTDKKIVGAMALVVAIVGAVVYPAYKNINDRIPKPFAVIDLLQITAEHEKVLFDALKSDSSDEQKKRVQALNEQFPKKLEKAVSEIAENCDCTLLVSAAVIHSDGLMDFTQNVKDALKNAN